MGVIFPCINGPVDTEQAECEQAGVPGGRAVALVQYLHIGEPLRV